MVSGVTDSKMNLGCDLVAAGVVVSFDLISCYVSFHSLPDSRPYNCSGRLSSCRAGVLHPCRNKRESSSTPVVHGYSSWEMLVNGHVHVHTRHLFVGVASFMMQRPTWTGTQLHCEGADPSEGSPARKSQDHSASLWAGPHRRPHE